MAGPLRGGRAINEKNNFASNVPKRSRGGGGFGLNGPAIKRRTFFAASLREFIYARHLFVWLAIKSFKVYIHIT